MQHQVSVICSHLLTLLMIKGSCTKYLHFAVIRSDYFHARPR